MASEHSQRNTRAQDIEVLRAKDAKFQKRMKSRDWKNEREKKHLIRNMVSNRKRLDDLEAVGAVDKGIKEAQQ